MPTTCSSGDEYHCTEPQKQTEVRVQNPNQQRLPLNISKAEQLPVDPLHTTSSAMHHHTGRLCATASNGSLPRHI